LLLLTPAWDARDPTLGFVVGWACALRNLVPRITVVTLRAAEATAPHAGIMVRAVGGGARGVVGLRLLRTVAAIDRPDVALAHMNWPMPLAALPALRWRRVPLALWWAHGTAPMGLRFLLPHLALVLSSTAAAFPLPTRRLCVVGQGIDTMAFAPAPDEAPPPFTVITAGRLAPVKRVPLVQEACARAGVALRVLGPGSSESSSLPHAAMPEALRAAHAFATASATGSPDKAALEAMACALPVVALGDGLRDALPADLARQVIMPDTAAFAARLAALAAMPEASRRGFGLQLRAAVIAAHDRAQQQARLVAALSGLHA
jgi:glycosyltransferase involved in cell wall biosynthesis